MMETMTTEAMTTEAMTVKLCNDYVDEGSDSGDYDTDESSSSDWDY